MVRDISSSYKIDYIIVIKNFLNPEGHQNPFNGSKVTAILLKGQIWWSFSGGGSAINGATPSSLFYILTSVSTTPSKVVKIGASSQKIPHTGDKASLDRCG